MSADEIRVKIQALYAAHPSLKGIDPVGFCCAECFRHDLAGAHGWDAVDAWDEIQALTIRLQLGDPT